MGLKCSVLGHTYGDATVERDREEQGSEVVITIREIETCGRCGEERVVSENKEVTTIATPEEPDRAGATDDVGPADDETDGDHEPANEPAVTPNDAAGGPAGSSAGDDSPTVEQNEGVEILDAEADDRVGDDELTDPSIGDAGFGTEDVAEEPTEDDAVIMDEDDEDGRAPGEWPEESPDRNAEPEWTPADEPDDQSSPTTGARTEYDATVTVPDGQFRCPSCEFTTPVESSSLRAGDFCPECQTGSLVHETGDVTRKE